MVNLTELMGYSVSCMDCNASGPVGDTQEQAFEMWTNRHGADNFLPQTKKSDMS